MFFLTVMNVSFAAVSIEANEGDCTVILQLDITEGVLGPVSIQLFTVSGTARGNYYFLCVTYYS